LLGPRQTLDRGYSITLDNQQRVVRSPHTLKAGDRILTKLAEGEVNSVVEQLPDEPAAFQTEMDGRSGAPSRE